MVLDSTGIIISIIADNSVGLHCPESVSDLFSLPSSLPFFQRQYRVVVEGVGSGVTVHELTCGLHHLLAV